MPRAVGIPQNATLFAILIGELMLIANGWRVPTLLELAIIFGMGVLMISIAIIQFRKAE